MNLFTVEGVYLCGVRHHGIIESQWTCESEKLFVIFVYNDMTTGAAQLVGVDSIQHICWTAADVSWEACVRTRCTDREQIFAYHEVL